MKALQECLRVLKATRIPNCEDPLNFIVEMEVAFESCDKLLRQQRGRPSSVLCTLVGMPGL